MRSYNITVRESGHSFPCKEDEFLLAAMRRSAGGPIPCGCYGGGCGICRMRVDSGEFLIEKRMSRAHITKEEELDGYVLLCCVKPRGDMVVSGAAT